MMKTSVLVHHPMVAHSLTVLRDRTTTTAEFRRHADLISRVLVIKATKHLALSPKRIETPLASFEGSALEDSLIVVPVLRAGLALLYAVQDFLPSSAVGFIGLERDEKTAIAREYYKKLPKILSSHKVAVLDPMLATGGSADDTVSALKDKGAQNIICICIVCAKEGLDRMAEKHPDVSVFTAAIDQELTTQKFILPGLGDFGDRYFGTT